MPAKESSSSSSSGGGSISSISIYIFFTLLTLWFLFVFVLFTSLEWAVILLSPGLAIPCRRHRGIPLSVAASRGGRGPDQSEERGHMPSCL